MKNFLILVAGFTAFGLASCEYDSTKSTENSAVTDSAHAEKKEAVIPKAICYSGVVGKDTIDLKLEQVNNSVSGHLSYNFYEKDDNSGILDGKLFGDTLVADYKYRSEGTVSIREVIFLVNKNSAVEGFGPMEEKNGKMMFKSRNEVDFSNGIALHEIVCATE